MKNSRSNDTAVAQFLPSLIAPHRTETQDPPFQNQGWGTRLYGRQSVVGGLVLAEGLGWVDGEDAGTGDRAGDGGDCEQEEGGAGEGGGIDWGNAEEEAGG
jgi:hypothetical protein